MSIFIMGCLNNGLQNAVYLPIVVIQIMLLPDIGLSGLAHPAAQLDII